jgi:hypothetical protein
VYMKREQNVGHNKVIKLRTQKLCNMKTDADMITNDMR